MLSKLIKYDFKALSRMLWPTMAAVVGATLIAALCFLFDSKTIGNANGGLIQFLAGMLAVIMVLAIIAAAFLVFFVICAHFYRNLMTDQGYLTFTLPVKTSDILWSKLITAMLWSIISGAIICLSAFMFVGIVGAGGGAEEFMRALSQGFKQLFSYLGGQGALLTIEFILLGLAGLAFSVLHIYLALVIGGVVSEKHKVLAGIGFYFIISIVVGIVTSIAQYYFGGSLLQQVSGFGLFTYSNEINDASRLVSAAQPYYWFNLIFTLAMDAGCFLLSKYFLENKLNLE